MKALILAAGRGTRVQPLTHTVPKPMIPIVHKPVMEMLVDQLRSHYFLDIIVNTSYLAPQIESYFRDGHRFGVRMAYSFEGYEKDGVLVDAAEGSAGAIRKIHQHSGFFDRTFLVVCGDAIIDLDLTELLRVHREKKAMVTIALKTVPTSELQNYGVAVQDAHGRITSFQEKPKPGEEKSRLANTGIYIFEPEILSWIPETGPYDIGGQLFPRLTEMGAAIYGVELPFQWLDIGRLQDYHHVVMQSMLGYAPPYDLPGVPVRPDVWAGPNIRANFNKIETQGRIYIGGSASIGDGCTLVGPVVIGAGAVIEAGTYLENTIVGEYTRVCEGGYFKGKIVGNGYCVDADGSVLDGRHTDTSWLFRDARSLQIPLNSDQLAVLENANNATTQ
jgi:mannose-1-phosphate guanylyltransferase